MQRVQIKLKRIICNETEDVGEDEFYAVAVCAIYGKDSNELKYTVTDISPVWSVNEPNTYRPDYLFFGRSIHLDEGDHFTVRIFCMDQDIAADLENIPEDFLKHLGERATQLANDKKEEIEKAAEVATELGIGDALASLNPIKSAVSAATDAIDYVWNILRRGLALDKDDELGRGDLEHFARETDTLPDTIAHRIVANQDDANYYVDIEAVITAS